MAACAAKKRHPNRMAAEHALSFARQQYQTSIRLIEKQKKLGRPIVGAAHPWVAEGIPIRVYQCDECGGGWHLTHVPKREARVKS